MCCGSRPRRRLPASRPQDPRRSRAGRPAEGSRESVARSHRPAERVPAAVRHVERGDGGQACRARGQRRLLRPGGRRQPGAGRGERVRQNHDRQADPQIAAAEWRQHPLRRARRGRLGGTGPAGVPAAGAISVPESVRGAEPTVTILRSLLEPLIIHDIGRSLTERVERVAMALDRVHLTPVETFFPKYPHQLSGGQLQRVVIARALLVDPLLLVADEPVSMPDVSIRAGVLNLMRDLSRERKLTTIYISHDLALIRYMCRVAALTYLGPI